MARLVCHPWHLVMLFGQLRLGPQCRYKSKHLTVNNLNCIRASGMLELGMLKPIALEISVCSESQLNKNAESSF